MKRLSNLHFLLIFYSTLSIAPIAGAEEEKPEPEIFELSAFVVYGGEIDTIDGLTGEAYNKSNTVVEEFRAGFNDILMAYHRRLLLEEMRYVKESSTIAEPFVTSLNELANSFGIKEIDPRWDSFLSIEKSIIDRLIKDPFFKIEALVVWDLQDLENNRNRLPANAYADQIRYNPDKEKWERRVTTEWRVSYTQYRENGTSNYVSILKEQGLNLDTNEGYHLIDRGLTQFPPAEGFKEVKLTYPIFINNGKSVDEQVQYLKKTFVNNLVHIYDPFSWWVRRNVRFRGGFANRMQEQVEIKRFRVTDPEWFEPLLANFLNDVITTRQMGVAEIYDLEMLRKVRVNSNLLGRKFDLLNWKTDENRYVNYDPTRQAPVNLNFNNHRSARFVLLDAYRRFPKTFIPILREKILSIKSRTSGKELIKEAIAEASGMPADVYIRKAIAAQKAELEKFRYKF